jgi:hypothetical protein
MGSWGTGIFQDDFACDVRDYYNELVSLRFDDGEILDELKREFGVADGIDESTFWIALALLQHRLGRLTEDVRRQACEFIDTGRALNDWIELTEEGDPSIKSREKQLQKAKAAILSPQPPRKTPALSKELRLRIDRTYEPYPWKPGNLYSYKTESGEYLVFAATDVHPLKLRRHYSKQGARHVRVEMPELLQPCLLLLDYREPVPPDAGEAGNLRPYLGPATAEERRSWLDTAKEIRAMFQGDSSQSYEEFERQNRSHHPNATDEQFRRRYVEYIEYCGEQFQKYSDPEEAADRFRYRLFMLDPKEPVPSGRVTDLQISRRFVREMECTPANWAVLDGCAGPPGLGEP